MGKLLRLDQRNELLVRHRGERDRRVADRIKAVILYDEGWSYTEIAHALLLSDEAIRKHISDFISKEKLNPENGGSEAKLEASQTQKLLAHLDEAIYTDVKEICDYVWVTFGEYYSRSGMTQWLKRNGFSYHKPAVAPAKADAKKQKDFIDRYEKLKKNLSKDEKIVFMDSVHPTHQMRPTHGWIRKGTRKELPTNSGKKRMNIVGALGLEDMSLFAQEFETVDHEAIILFLKNLEIRMPEAKTIHVVLDGAGYHKCAEVQEHVKNSRIKLHVLPPYSPNLNVIERCWKIMHEHVTNNRYYATFKEFADAVLGFLNETFPEKARLWIDRLSDNFTPIQSPLMPILQS